MSIETAIPPWEKPILKAFEGWSEKALTLTLIGIGLFCIFVAIRKDNAILKAVLITWILMP